nr:unnamed protein product [Digitaria exilis]
MRRHRAERSYGDKVSLASSTWNWHWSPTSKTKLLPLSGGGLPRGKVWLWRVAALLVIMVIIVVAHGEEDEAAA